jgi:hypothetical protein
MLGVAVLLGVGALGAGALAEDTSPVQAEADSGLPTWEQVAAKIGLQGEAATLSFAEEMILAARIQGHVMTDAEVARMVENFDTLSPDTVAEVGPLLP